jgi:hypothetical protein
LTAIITQWQCFLHRNPFIIIMFIGDTQSQKQSSHGLFRQCIDGKH